MRRFWSVLSVFRRPARGNERLARRGLTLTVSPDELDGGYVAQVDAFPGCVGQGETPEEAVEAAFEVLLDLVHLRVHTEVSDHREAFHEPRRFQVVG